MRTINNCGNLGISAAILLISMILISSTVFSIITQGTETSNPSQEEDFEQLTEDIYNEISTYIQIKDQKGKYYSVGSHQKIQKIAIWISPLVTQNIDLSQLTVQIDNGDNVNILTYSFNTSSIKHGGLFEHQIWENMTGYNFGLITITDKDESITQFGTINENTDNAYVIFKLPPNMALLKNDKLKISFFPNTGITRTTLIKAPLPMSSVVTFD